MTIHQQVLARLTKISSLALQKLNGLIFTEESPYSSNLSREALDSLVASAATNPDVMEYWILQSSRLERYYYSGIDDTFRKKPPVRLMRKALRWFSISRETAPKPSLDS